MFPDKASITRFISAIVTLLAFMGYNVPENVIEAVFYIPVFIFLVYSMYKNNDLTVEAVKGTDLMKDLKAEKGIEYVEDEE